MNEPMILPARLDSSATPALLASLLSRRGEPLVVAASRVEMIGALAFEVLVAAGRQWRSDGHVLSISDPSERYQAAAAALGLDALHPWGPDAATEGKVAA